MIKGVNKKVLEINNPRCLYFDKAVLYLKPNLNCVSYKLLQTEAEEMLKSMSPDPPKNKLIRKTAAAAAVFAAGFLTAVIIFI